MAQARKFDLNTVKEFARQCSNWGKWGAEDKLGTINYITPEKVRQVAQLVKNGKVISLAIPFDSKGPQTGGFGRFNPIHNPDTPWPESVKEMKEKLAAYTADDQARVLGGNAARLLHL